MGLTEWLKRKSAQKSAENVARTLPALVRAVKDDWLTEGDLASGDVARVQWGRIHSPDARAEVAAAQNELYTQVLVYSSVPVDVMFNDVVIPILANRQLVTINDQYFGRCVIAAFRACEAAAKERGIDLSQSVEGAKVMELIRDAPTLYRMKTTPG